MKKIYKILSLVSVVAIFVASNILATSSNVVISGTFDSQEDCDNNWSYIGNWIASGGVSPISGGNIWFNGPGAHWEQTFVGITLIPQTKYKVSFDAICVPGSPASQTIDVGLKYMSGEANNSIIAGDIEPENVASLSGSAMWAEIPGDWKAAGRFSCPINQPDSPSNSHFFIFNTPLIIQGPGTNEIGISIQNCSGIQVRLDNVKVAIIDNVDPPPAPQNTIASIGTYSNKIAVSWDNVGEADSYQVWRNNIADSSSAVTNSAEISTNYFEDVSPTNEIYYYYWVKSKNLNGESGFGNCATGLATASLGPNQPTNISPADSEIISSFPVILESSPYSDDDGYPFAVSQWQIDNKSSFSFIDWDSGEVTNETNITIPSSPLTTQSFWRVRYKNNKNVWSEWSTPTVFNAQRDTTSPYIFLDTFNNVSGSGDVNKDYAVPGRQFGTVAPCEYYISGTTEAGASGKLTLSGEDSSCTPGYNFGNNKEFKLEFDFEPSAPGTGISICKINKNASPFSNGGMGFVFYGDGSGAYKVHRNSIEFTLTNDLIKSSSFHFMIAVSQTDEAGDLFSIFIDGEPLPLGRFDFVDPVTNLYNHINYFYMFRPGEDLFDDNFITLYNFGGNATIDNFKITPVSTTYSTRTWENDEDLWIGTSNEVAAFTHAVNLNWTNNASEPVDVEGLVFECPEYIRLQENLKFDDSNPETKGTNWAVFGPDGWISAFGTEDAGQPLAADLPDGDAEKIARRCVYGWGSSIGIKLTDLTPNSSNIFNFYGRPLVTDKPRGGYLSGNDGGFCYVDENVVTDKCQIIEYEYIAGSDGTFTLTFTSAQGQDYMLYGFSSIETGVPEPISVICYLLSVIGIFFAVSRTLDRRMPGSKCEQ